MKYRILALLLAGMMLTACASASGQSAPTLSTVRTSSTVTTTTAPISTVEATETTSAPVITVETPVTTTAPITTETPVTEAPETTAPSTMTQEPITTETPITTEAPVTSTDTPVTDVPITTTKPTIGTTETPVTTTTAPITTTQAPETTFPPVTEAPTVHTHSYGAWKTTQEATCTADGTQKRTCECGESEIKTIDATGHSYGSWAETKAATESAEGEEARTCKACQKKETRKIAKLEHVHAYGEWVLCDDYIYETRTCSCGEVETKIHYATETDERLIADRVIYYINKYRAEEGTPTATKLERLTLVAEMRSEQLTTNYKHNTTEFRECLTYYQYGEYFDPTEWGIEGDPYYRAPVGEAISGPCVYIRDSIDEIAKKFADSFRNSPGHWRYVGGSSPYIAIGIAYGGECVLEGKSYDDCFYCALFTCSTAEYE